MTHSINSLSSVPSSTAFMDMGSGTTASTLPDTAEKDIAKTSDRAISTSFPQPGAQAQKQKLMALANTCKSASPDNRRSDSGTIAERRGAPALAVTLASSSPIISQTAEATSINGDQCGSNTVDNVQLDNVFKELQRSGQTRAMVTKFYSGLTFDELF